MTTATERQRRVVRYDSLAEFRADVERIASGPYETVGNWSFAQILTHLATAFNGSLDGYGIRGPWILRSTLGRLLKRRVLTKPMRPGFRLWGRARTMLQPADNVELDSALEAIRAALDRLEHEAPTHPHPILGCLTPKEHIQLHCRHAELHMSFVRPVDRPVPNS